MNTLVRKVPPERVKCRCPVCNKLYEGWAHHYECGQCGCGVILRWLRPLINGPLELKVFHVKWSHAIEPLKV